MRCIDLKTNIKCAGKTLKTRKLWETCRLYKHFKNKSTTFCYVELGKLDNEFVDQVHSFCFQRPHEEAGNPHLSWEQLLLVLEDFEIQWLWKKRSGASYYLDVVLRILNSASFWIFSKL